MTIVDFEHLKMTTMTAIIDLEGIVDIESAFPLLPVTKLEIPDMPRTSKKFKIPWPGKEHAGKIFSVKFQTVSRGISKTLSNKAFRNSISLDICTSEKNIAAKLSATNIHMCGPNSESVAYEAANLLIEHLKNLQVELDYINQHLKERDIVVKWLWDECKGTKYTINEETQEIVTLGPGETIRHGVVHENGRPKTTYKEYTFKWEDGDHIDKNGILVNKYKEPYFRALTKQEKKEGKKDYPVMRKDECRLELDSIPLDPKGKKIIKIAKIPLKVMEVYSIRIPPSVKIDNEKMTFPEHLDERICRFLIRYIGDYAYHHVLCGFLNNFRDITKIYTPPANGELRAGKINIAMANYSYSLNMKVDRWQLCQLIDGVDGFSARYNNTTDHHVTVTLPYTPEEGESIKRKSLEKCHTFMVYKTGIVTQSGPHPRLMKDVYLQFMNFIESVRDKIRIDDDRPFNVKFKPSTSL